MNLYSAPSSHPLLRGAPNYSADTVLEFSRRSAVSVSKGLAQGPYAMVRGGVRTRDLSIHDQRRYLGATTPHKIDGTHLENHASRLDTKQRDEHMSPHEKQRTKEDIINFIIGLYIYTYTYLIRGFTKLESHKQLYLYLFHAWV